MTLFDGNGHRPPVSGFSAAQEGTQGTTFAQRVPESPPPSAQRTAEEPQRRAGNGGAQVRGRGARGGGGSRSPGSWEDSQPRALTAPRGPPRRPPRRAGDPKGAAGAAGAPGARTQLTRPPFSRKGVPALGSLQSDLETLRWMRIPKPDCRGPQSLGRPGWWRRATPAGPARGCGPPACRLADAPRALCTWKRNWWAGQ